VVAAEVVVPAVALAVAAGEGGAVVAGGAGVVGARAGGAGVVATGVAGAGEVAEAGGVEGLVPAVPVAGFGAVPVAGFGAGGTGGFGGVGLGVDAVVVELPCVGGARVGGAVGAAGGVGPGASVVARGAAWGAAPAGDA